MAKDYSKPDFWSQKARQEGYPARSVYKLKEMDEKFGLLRAAGQGKSFKVLDLGAAPGSWSLYILRRFAAGGKNAGNCFLSAVDLAPLSAKFGQDLFASGNFFFIQGDMCAEDNRAALAERGPYNLIVSDAAPATTGNRSVDTLRSLALAEMVLDYGGLSLAKGGSLVLKIFQGGDTGGVLKAMKTMFSQAKSFKPEACRNESFETYYLGLGKK